MSLLPSNPCARHARRAGDTRARDASRYGSAEDHGHFATGAAHARIRDSMCIPREAQCRARLDESFRFCNLEGAGAIALNIASVPGRASFEWSCQCSPLGAI
jgi:hypothetical protein